MMKIFHTYPILCAVTLALARFVFVPQVQAQSASVVGRVADSSGFVVPGAKVTIRNTATNVVSNTVTDVAGHYAVPSIPPGNYDISASKEGFSTSKQTGILLTVSQSAIFNLTLQPGQVQQTVTVRSEASGVQTASTALGAVIGSKTILSLPLAGRNFTQLLALTPGVSSVNVAQNGVFHPIGTAVIPSVNGQRNRSNMFYVDGVNDLGSFNGTYNYEPIVDAIQEFRVLSHSDLAEFGGATGGIISVVTRGGTNQFHGTLWEFIRNSALGNAKTYFTGTLNPLRWNQFGGVVGGPVWIPKVYDGHNRTFFFFAYEGYRDSQHAQSFQTTPTAAQLSGDFSALCQTFNSSGICTNGTQLYDPYTTSPDPNKPGSFLRTPFPNNNISSKLSPSALLYSKTIFPTPNLSTP
ncbi:MAG: carboxypeptidase regulatory-like domain-containing protein, partial [Edaphobacter sp.]